MHLYNTVFVHFSNLIHNTFKPIKRTLFPSDPIEISPGCSEVICTRWGRFILWCTTMF
ncbi:hypothetical protein HanIR_Chr02g0055001 [Helianthus annuus]|nr:hypothetical protein HanIR_Chr02g0055001 [Helianthus annuus]